MMKVIMIIIIIAFVCPTYYLHNIITIVFNKLSSSFSSVQILPNPYGVISYKNTNTQKKKSSSSMQQLEVVVSGVLLSNNENDDDKSDYEVGIVYYANTMGEIISSHQYSGRGGSSSSSVSSVRSSSSSSNNGGIVRSAVYDENTDTILSSESQVGVAISVKDLLIRMYN